MRQSTRHQFGADVHLLGWLEQQGRRYDVVCDHEDLHGEGVRLLAPYDTVLTGSHPEYWTGAMLDGLEEYLSRGGRLMYLGGNGFYWVTSIDPHRRHVLEVRRGHAVPACGALNPARPITPPRGSRAGSGVTVAGRPRRCAASASPPRGLTGRFPSPWMRPRARVRRHGCWTAL